MCCQICTFYCPLRKKRCIYSVLLFCIYLFLLTLVLVLQCLFLHWGNLIMLLSPFPLTFLETQNGYSSSSDGLWLFSWWLGRSLWSSERCSMGEDIFELSASAAASEFGRRFRLLELMYTYLIVNIRSSLTHLHGFQLFMTMP